MTATVTIRESRPNETGEVLALYPQAFPDEELRPVVSALIEGDADVLSLVACDCATLVAHVLFTLCEVPDNPRKDALLAPLGVIPAFQKQGVGTAIVRAALDRLKTSGIGRVFVLGDPNYYGRFGFRPERRVLAPYDIPAEWADAWQSLKLSATMPPSAGRLALPDPWMDPALWTA
ncbi:MAG: N-acetyltransferase [Pseudomonadota bacterium]